MWDEKRIRKIEKRLSLMEISTKKKSQSKKKWIENLFINKTNIPVDDIREAAKKMGWSWQSIQIVRREHLSDRIGIGSPKGYEGKWQWVKI